ncbi:MAG: hypothetical protein WCI88_03250 [Chloroflexota bacterium]
MFHHLIVKLNSSWKHLRSQLGRPIILFIFLSMVCITLSGFFLVNGRAQESLSIIKEKKQNKLIFPRTGTLTRLTNLCIHDRLNEVSHPPSISSDGRLIAFLAFNAVDNSDDMGKIFLFDRNNGKIRSIINGYTHPSAPLISSDGHVMVFQSEVNDLTEGKPHNISNIFLYNNQTGAIERISQAIDGTPANDNSYAAALSTNGRFVVFQSKANNLVPGASNNEWNIYLKDRDMGSMQLISNTSDGKPGNHNSYHPSISADGRFIVFSSQASNLTSADRNNYQDIFMYDNKNKETRLISTGLDDQPANGDSLQPTISANGRFIVFASYASNLVEKDENGVMDVFVYDIIESKMSLVSKASDGKQGNFISDRPSISTDGRYIVFESLADTLASGDDNQNWDVYLHDYLTGSTERISSTQNGVAGDDLSDLSVISNDGTTILFQSFATNLAGSSPAFYLYQNNR